MDRSDLRPPAIEATGLYSTTQIHHLMRVEFGRAQRYGYPLSLAAVAIDRHEALRAARGVDFVSDAVLKVAELLRDNTRACDHLGSLVDRRLVVVLPHTEREGAEALGRRLVASVEELDLTHEGERVPVTISVGVSTFADANTMFFDALTDAAEGALGRARREGGGRVEYCAPGEEG